MQLSIQCTSVKKLLPYNEGYADLGILLKGIKRY